MARILVPLPDTDFDTTEVAVPWRLLTRAGHTVVFATENAAVAQCDPLLLTGVLFGHLGAEEPARRYYHEMLGSPEFAAPLAWRKVVPTEFDALLLPGGHASGMRQYLSSLELQRIAATFATSARPIAAICHGVLVLARASDPVTGRSVLYLRRSTCLPMYMEALAYGLTFWKLGRYYRTYPAYVESEVRAALASPAQFVRGPLTIGNRGSETSDAGAFVHTDGNYISARWPGDAYLLARTLIAALPPARAAEHAE